MPSDWLNCQMCRTREPVPHACLSCLQAHGVSSSPEATPGQPSEPEHPGHERSSGTEADTRDEEEQEGPELEVSDEGLDGVLRCLEVLAASPTGQQGLLTSQQAGPLVNHLVDLLLAEPGSSVAESLVIALVDLDAATSTEARAQSSLQGAAEAVAAQGAEQHGVGSTAAAAGAGGAAGDGAVQVPGVARALVAGGAAVQRLHGLLDVMTELEQRHGHVRRGVRMTFVLLLGHATEAVIQILKHCNSITIACCLRDVLLPVRCAAVLLCSVQQPACSFSSTALVAGLVL